MLFAKYVLHGQVAAGCVAAASFLHWATIIEYGVPFLSKLDFHSYLANQRVFRETRTGI